MHAVARWPFLSLILLLIQLAASMATAAEPPRFRVVQPIFQTNMFFNQHDFVRGPARDMHSEITPWAISDGRQPTYFLISSYHSYLCRTTDNIFALKREKRIFDTGTCSRRLRPGLTATSHELQPLWKRDYHGAITAHLIKTKRGPVLFTFNHNEHKNNSGRYLRGKKCVLAADIGYGLSRPCNRPRLCRIRGCKCTSRRCTECLRPGCQPCRTPGCKSSFSASYNGGISMSAMAWTKANRSGNTQLSELGPIIWPSNGYVEKSGQRWIKATDGGVRIPASIIHDGYAYVYYRDMSQGNERAGRGAGFKVARAQIGPNGINPHGFRTYFRGRWTDKALPADFKLANYQKSYAKKGGRADNIFPDVPIRKLRPIPGTGRTDRRQFAPSINFSVAKIKGHNKFIGVEFRRFGGVYLRLSDDLVNWSRGTLIPGTREPRPLRDIKRLPMRYPHFLNTSGTSNTLIDPKGFYVVGMHFGRRGGNPRRGAHVMNATKLRLDPSSLR